jgi:ABC-2 type transport system ATP-binding protein
LPIKLFNADQTLFLSVKKKLPEYCIETNELTKHYDKVIAVDHISFKVRKGEVFGFLGPNGAGKTTTIKMLTTLLKPTYGSATVLGFDLLSEGNRIRPRIGVVQQEASYENSLSVEGNLDLYGFLWNMPKKERDERTELLLEKFGLKEVRKTAPPELSMGQRRRLQVAREFMHDCQLMFLDEPTIGLDPQARRTTLDYVQEKVKNGMTVFFTTHVMEEAEYVCDRIAIINHGKILALDTVENIKRKFGGVSVIHLRVTNGRDVLNQKLEKLSGIERIVFPQQLDEPLKVYARDADTVLSQIIDIIVSSGLHVEELRIKEPSLDDVFIQMTNSKGGASNE